MLMIDEQKENCGSFRPTIGKPTVGSSTVNKPNKPTEPLWEDFKTPILPNGTNYLGDPLFQKLDWIEAKKKYDKELKKYEADLENYEQTKLIRLIRNSTEKYCLKAFKIMKR